jgi:hypothetical protein
MNIIEIKRTNFRGIAVQKKWATHAVSTVESIAKTWLDSEIALSVLLFFRDDNDLHAYMPTVPIGTKNMQEVKTLQGAQGKPTIIGVECYQIEEALKELDFSIISEIMKQNYWHGREVFHMSDNDNILQVDVDKPATWEQITYGRDRIQKIKSLTGKTPTTLVRAIEAMQREYDEFSGFAQCQIESHSFAIKLDGVKNKGKLIAQDLIRFVENHSELFNIVNPGETKRYALNYVAFVPGSSCLVGDLDIIPDEEEKVDKVAMKEVINKAEKRMSTIVEAAPVLVDKSKTPVERVKEFKKKTGLSNEKAYAAMHGLSKMRGSRQTVALYSNKTSEREGTEVHITIDGTATTQIAELKRTLAAIIEPDNTRELTGKIVELDHYKDNDLKFGVYVDDELRSYSVHYPVDEDKKVREKKGQIVSLTVMREGPNRPWYFQEWKG